MYRAQTGAFVCYLLKWATLTGHLVMSVASHLYGSTEGGSKHVLCNKQQDPVFSNVSNLSLPTCLGNSTYKP